jgi:putative peptidoglycan lipid II flippase
MFISLGSIAVNYAINSLLVGPFGHVGLAFSTSAVALVNFLLLAFLMRRRVGRLEGNRLGLKLARICAASIPMAAVAWLVSEFSAGLPLTGIALRLVRVSAAITLAAVTFYFACKLLRIEELDEAVDGVAGRFLRLLRRK